MSTMVKLLSPLSHTMLNWGAQRGIKVYLTSPRMFKTGVAYSFINAISGLPTKAQRANATAAIGGMSAPTNSPKNVQLQRRSESLRLRGGAPSVGCVADLAALETVVLNFNACALPGCKFKFDPFITSLYKAVGRGFVRHDHAAFVSDGLRWGFSIGLTPGSLRGRRVFRNYPSALTAHASVSKAILARLNSNKSVDLGPAPLALRDLDSFRSDYFVFPMGAVAKPHEPTVMRPTSDHTRTGLNAATVMGILEHSLDAYRQVCWFLKKGYFMYVSDVADAFLNVPLAPFVWYFMLFKWRLPDARSDHLFAHLFGDFGTKGLPGTWKIILVDVIVQMAKSELVITLPLVVYVDDTALIGPCKVATRREFKSFQEWSTDVTGITWKDIKDRDCAIPQLYIGFWWDSLQFTRCLDEQKLRSYLAEFRVASTSRSLTLKERQSLAGKMQRSVLTLPPGAACLLVSCYRMMSGLSLQWQARRTSKAERDDYRFVHDLLQLNMGRGYYSYAGFDVGPTVLSDASKSTFFCGGGYVASDGRYSFFSYGASAARNPIDALEGDTVVRACLDMAPQWRGKIIPFGIDNSAFQLSAAKGRSKAQRLNSLVRHLFALQIAFDFVLDTFWISTSDNYLADHLSRDREEEFLAGVGQAGFVRPGSPLVRSQGAGAVVNFSDGDPGMAALRQLLRSYSSNTMLDGPSGRSRGDAQVLSVSYPPGSILDGLPPELEERLSEVLDNRLAPSSRQKVISSFNRWSAFCETRRWSPLLRTGFDQRGGRLAAWILSMLDDTELVYASISTYVWGVRTWHVLQHQADPAFGLMFWKELMAGVAVLSSVPGEPRKQVPLEVVEAILAHIDDLLSDPLLPSQERFRLVQFRLIMLILLLTFTRVECPCPKAWTGPNAFIRSVHWTTSDFRLFHSEHGWVLWVRFKGLKQDPRIERPSASADPSWLPWQDAPSDVGHDWVPIGDVPGSPFSIRAAYMDFVRTLGEASAEDSPRFWAKDRSRPYTYTCLRADFKSMLAAVGADESLGPHGLRVLGYNLSKLANGVELTVAHGGWLSSGHSRYERFDLPSVYSIPARMLARHNVFVSGVRDVHRARARRGAENLPSRDDSTDSEEEVAGGSAEVAPLRPQPPPGYVREVRMPQSGRAYPMWRSPGGRLLKSRAAAWRHFEEANLFGETSEESDDGSDAGTGSEAANSGVGDDARSRLVLQVVDTPPPPRTPAPAAASDASPGTAGSSRLPFGGSVSVEEWPVDHCANPRCTIPSVNGKHLGLCKFPTPTARRRSGR